MSIIFDLDDTLIDTTPLTLHQQVELGRAFEQLGISGAYPRLCALDREKGSLKEATCALLELEERDDLLPLALSILEAPPPPHIPVQPWPGALELLLQLKEKFPLYLVSRGKEEVQLGKLERAGLDQRLFRRMIILTEGSKEKAYKELKEAFHITPPQSFVCGDRPEIDLRPAKELGFQTIHMKRGRGSLLEGAPGVVDWVVCDIAELKALLT